MRKFDQSPVTWLRGFLSLTILGLTFAGSAQSYSSTKSFNFTMFPNAGMPPVILWTHRLHAKAVNLGGTDELEWNDRIEVSPPAGPPPSGIGRTVEAKVADAYGKAESWYILSPAGPAAGQNSGDIGVDGLAWVIPPPAGTGVLGFASSLSEIGWAWKQVVDPKRGIIRYVKYHRVATTSGATNRAVVNDPIVIRFWDEASGDVYFEDPLFQVDMDLEGDGNASIALDENLLTVNALSGVGHVVINLGNAFTTVQGTLALDVANGVVTGASTTGVYAGVLPAVGAPAHFSSVIGSYDLIFDYSSALPNEVNTDLTMRTGGMATVPEPASMAILGFGVLAFLGARRKRK